MGQHHGAPPGTGESRVSLLTSRLRGDSRDSQIHPHQGVRVFFTVVYSPPALGGDREFLKHRLELSGYRRLFGEHIVAGRVWLNHLTGTAPYMEMNKIGNSWTARGYKADRFLDYAMVLAGLEYRFPLYRKLGSVLFFDGGKVAKSAGGLA